MKDKDTAFIKKTKKYLTKLYTDAYKHISLLSNELPESTKEELKIDTPTEKLAGEQFKKKGIDSLAADINKLKGKKTNHELRLQKKKIKNQLKRKLKSEKIKDEKHLKKKIKQENEFEKSENTLIFNKFDFSGLELEKKRNRKGKQITEKDPVKALEKIQQFEEKISELKKAGENEKAKEMINKKAWKTAILKAEGLKVKDNVPLLRKSIKKRENMKNKSSKKWKERNEQIQKRKDDSQKKRKENILKKKKEKKAKKIKRSIKKGRVVL